MNYEIDDILELVKYINEYGLTDIAKVSFYITDDEHPHEFRNVILRNHGEDEDGFIPEFCDTEHAEADMNLVLGALDIEGVDMHELFVKYIRVEEF